jgi:hypothetical protein
MCFLGYLQRELPRNFLWHVLLFLGRHDIKWLEMMP